MDLDNIEIKKEPVIIFMGTPDFAACILEGLISKYKIRAIVTQPDKKVGRGGNIKYSPIKEIALKNKILCIQPERINEALEEIHSLEPDLIITCAYGQILPVELLQIPPLGCINVHASLLPKLRGGAPIHRAIIDGYEKSGITIMYMDKGMDTGDMISKKEVEITEDDTAASLHEKLKIVGKDLLLETLPSIINRTNKREKQKDEEATYAPIISKEDEKIDFTKNKKIIINQIRGLNSFPGAYCIFDNKRMKVWKARKGENLYENKVPGEITNIYSDGFGVKVENGEVIFTEVQLEGKSRTSASNFVNGHNDLIGKVLK
ncbi:MAG: methionyl-tRNA formyltransferase [Bacilli bacterium]|nr:methionyl-tRNA formyltransferase [Bacilli bacterium]